MAQLLDSRFLLTDASNVVQNGAKLRIYDAGTTNLTTVYSDAALSVPLTNPVVASSSGILPQVFAAEGTVVDLQWLTSADVAIPGRSYEDVTFVGSDTGDLTRTVTGNGRFKLTGSGGANLWQVGDPSPDNTGGTLTIEGWAGTQGDSITLDFAAIDTTGYIEERSKRLTGVVETPATTFTAVTSVDIPLTELPAGVQDFDVEIFDYSQSGNSPAIVRFSYDASATYKSGASDYKYGWWYYDTTTGTWTLGGVTTTTGIQVATNLNGGTDQAGVIRLRIRTPESGTAHTLMTYDARGIINTGAMYVAQGTGYGQGSYGRATHLRLLVTSNTMTGKYRVVPLRGFGEA